MENVMYYVYVLKSKSYTSKLYFGYAKDLQSRFTRHNNKGTKYTGKYSPWLLIYYEAYRSEKDARQREWRLKHDGRAWAQLKRRIYSSLNED